jgi:hypothetical protein
VGPSHKVLRLNISTQFLLSTKYVKYSLYSHLIPELNIANKTCKIYKNISYKDTTTVPREIAKNKLDLVGVQESRWDRGGNELADSFTFFYGNWNEKILRVLTTVYNTQKY